MKKILSCIMCLLFISIPLTACTQRPSNPPSPPPSQSLPQPAPEPEPEPEPPPIPTSGVSDIDPSRPIVALTFDDGPSKYTSQILDLLEQYGGRATFCVIGQHLDVHRDVIARAADMGNEIIGHSWDHKNLTSLTKDEIKRQILDTSIAIEAITGVPTSIYRPPFGRTDERLEDISGEIGFALIMWSIDPRDWEVREADPVYSIIMSEVQDGSIVIAHDVYNSTVEAMARVIPELVEQGYQLVTVSELLMYAHGSIEPGRLYKSAKE